MKKNKISIKKKIIIAIVIVLALISLIPVVIRYDDGGTVEYKAILYSVTKYHMLDDESETGYAEGTGIKIFGIEVYNSKD
ncbi:MAG: hypothetical protein GX896_09470 [Clostridiales bacterium]|nr:hypothetical protein [Clostridiales bacterium]